MTQEVKTITEDDWRGILAVIVVVGEIGLAALGIFLNRMDFVTTIITAFTTPSVLAVKWYFDGKESIPSV